MYFEYGEKETAYLSQKDSTLGEAISRIGHIYREADDDLFGSVVHNILAQQISTAAQSTVWSRLKDLAGTVDSKHLLELGIDGIQSTGTTFRKAGYIVEFAQGVFNGQLELDRLAALDDEALVHALTSIKGIGIWTAEMIMTFCLQRKDIVSFTDMGIIRGMRMLYGHTSIDRPMFDKYKARYSPYGTVASFYLWAISGGALEELIDPAKQTAEVLK